MSTVVESGLIMVLVLILLITLSLMMFNYFSPVIFYTKVSDVTRQHMNAIEEAGGLTTVERDSLLSDLQSRGIPPSKVVIATVPALDEKAQYGEFVSIKVTYNYDMEDIKSDFDGTNMKLSKGTKTKAIVVGKTGISKNSEE